MIYVKEKDFDRQIQLLSLLASSDDLIICAWLYPESEAAELSGLPVTDNPSSLKPVTTYENEVLARCTVPTIASKKIIKSFDTSYAELKKNCDSLALYKKSESSWLAATIGHEVCVLSKMRHCWIACSNQVTLHQPARQTGGRA